jgi:hypothetical protein
MRLIDHLPTRLGWLLHGVIGHPLMALCTFVGPRRLGAWAHNVTLPRD